MGEEDVVPLAEEPQRCGHVTRWAWRAMQVVQLMGGRPGRLALLGRVREHLRPGAQFGAGLANLFETVPPADALPPRVFRRDKRAAFLARQGVNLLVLTQRLWPLILAHILMDIIGLSLAASGHSP